MDMEISLSKFALFSLLNLISLFSLNNCRFLCCFTTLKLQMPLHEKIGAFENYKKRLLHGSIAVHIEQDFRDNAELIHSADTFS